MAWNAGRFIKILIFCVAALILKAGLQSSRDWYDPYNDLHPKASALFVFGDSLADAGNNNFVNASIEARADFAPYGQSFFQKPTGRFSDGRTLFDFIASGLGLPFPAPWFQPKVYLDISHGANFASAGSGLLDSTLQHLNVVPFERQVKEFSNFFHMLRNDSGYSAKYFLSNAVLAINVGANDIVGNYMVNESLHATVGPQLFVESLLKAYENYLLRLYQTGGRKFVVFGISPLGCSPGMRFLGLSRWKGECDPIVNALFQQFNSGLQKIVFHLNQNLEGGVFIYVNNYDFMLNLINNGKALGFSDTVSACCGDGPYNGRVGCGLDPGCSICKDPKEYVYWDRFHPTERVQSMIAEEVLGGDSSFVSPMNLRGLIQYTKPTPSPFDPLFTE